MIAEQKNRNYRRPPAVDAVIDFSFESELSDRENERLRRELSSRYPQVLETRGIEVAIQGDGKVETKTSVVARKLVSQDGADVFIIRPTALTTARLGPYTGWDHLRELALDNFRIANKIIGYRKCIRIGVRFINRIDIPIKEKPLVDFALFNFFPNFPAEMLGAPMSFLNRIEYKKETPGLTVIVATHSTEPALIDHTSYILDIDVIRNFDVPSKQDELWQLVDKMRDEKNLVFEACVTDDLRARFD